MVLKEALHSSGHLYPNLFAYVLSDLHTHIGNEKLYKTNCYSSYFDLISGKGNMPAVFQNFARQLSLAISQMTSEGEMYKDLKSVKASFAGFITGLLGQISEAELKSGSVRAEFRLKLSDYTSMYSLLNSVFCSSNLMDWTCCFTSIEISRLSKFYIGSFQNLIYSNLNNLMSDLSRTSTNSYFIMNRIATVSLLESLLGTTLFTGMQYNFVSQLVWNKSTAEMESLELLASIRDRNRPMIRSEFFTGQDFLVTASNELLDLCYGKITRTQIFQFPPVHQMISFLRPELTRPEKARILWQIYFAELNPNAFLPNPSRDPHCERWKFAGLNRNVISGFIETDTFEGIVNAIFSFDCFMKHSCWRSRYYMINAKKWVMQKKDGITVELLKTELIQAIRDMGIEHVHYAGQETYNANPSLHFKVNLADLTPAEKRERAERNIPAISARDAGLATLNSFSFRFRDSELLSLLFGVNKYGEGRWKKIKDDVCFPMVLNRTAKSLGDKWSDLKRSNVVIFCNETRRWIMPSLNSMPPESPQITINVANPPHSLQILSPERTRQNEHFNDEINGNEMDIDNYDMNDFPDAYDISSSQPDSVFEAFIPTNRRVENETSKLIFINDIHLIYLLISFF